eukprot:CAMPEP_0183728892 /NCGR_PEP_ID=MMETSP0737-20130205/29189_1 /TAXON_ID=385413 /ORGANISM="Thalassiosira miniscula, Strain CCMP1093" /LENGTH=287 /DNA_ID=CAMNT_0025960955 /DNA_START=9 /DNA_END=872 /DNA_ORIENTATION=+
MGIDTPLVDNEGFPRGDIDIYRARTLRKRFKEIQTDHKSLEKEIEKGLLEIAALQSSSSSDSKSTQTNTDSINTNKDNVMDEEEKKARLAPKPKPKFDPQTGKWVVKSWDGSVAGVTNGELRSFDDLYSESNSALAGNAGRRAQQQQQHQQHTAVSSSQQQQQQQQQSQPQSQSQVTFQENNPYTTPFAIIDQVSPNSPAATAGLVEGDILLQFGTVHSQNHNNFRAIAELVPIAAAEQCSIPVAVRRKTTELGGLVEVIKTERMELRPRTWAGRGLLGCHIIPYSE